MKNLLLLISILFAMPALATDVVINWTAPQTNADGSKPALFEGFNIYRGTALPLIIGKGPGPLAGGSTNPLSATTLIYTDKAVAPGTYYYGVTTWHCDTGGCSESIPNVSGAVVIKIIPGPPGSITVTVNGVQAPK